MKSPPFQTTAPKSSGATRSSDPTRAALEQLAGGALVLDASLKIVAATARAESLLGMLIPIGASATKMICGNSVDRPIAEALASGRAAEAIVARPTRSDPDRRLRVRAMPLGQKGARQGHLVFLEEAALATAEGAVQFQGMWTADAAMKRVFHVLERVAEVEAPVLVRGETGSGKELVATALHALSPRKLGPFRAINCAAMPANLLESELFGHARGAFTGAVRDEPGHVQLAHGGTLFLDEVAELPLELQAKLLRFLESHTVLPVGARQPVPVDVRIVSATHRSLRREVERGRFRADLMFRLRVIPVFLPPLRARTGDVMLLTERFIDERNRRGRRRIERIADAVKRLLASYDWPGNVRELQNVIEYAFAIGEGPVLLPTDLPPELIDPHISLEAVEAGSSTDFAPPPAVASTSADRETGERARIARALDRSGGNRERTAEILGISRITLWRRMKSLALIP